MISAISRPARAMREGALLLALIIAFRLPTIERRFAAALVAGAAPLPVAIEMPRSPGLLQGAPNAPIAAMTHLAVAKRRLRTGNKRRAPSFAEPQPDTARWSSDALAISVAPTFSIPNVAQLAVAAPTAQQSGMLATSAYEHLAAGDRRGAVRLFDAALEQQDARAPVWRAQRDALTRRWSGNAYSIVRGGGGALPVTPVLGGGQSGGGIAFTPDPLAPRPLALTVRGSVAHDDSGRSGFAAVGIQWHPHAGVTIAAERLIAVGPTARDDWTLRLATGIDQTRAHLRFTAYGEGGIVGHAGYAAGQSRVAAVIHDRDVDINPGAGVWASIQGDRGATVDRVDLGPGVIVHTGLLALELDYRFRVAGNASPRSGPVLTLSAAL